MGFHWPDTPTIHPQPANAPDRDVVRTLVGTPDPPERPAFVDCRLVTSNAASVTTCVASAASSVTTIGNAVRAGVSARRAR